jgi:serine phosphatase RsbU (regulator of sigma subunit)
VASTALALNPRDVLLVYSDGLTDAENPAGEMFGTERVQQIMRSACPGGAAELERRLLRAIQEFTQDQPLTDDITILIVERTSS